MNLESNLIVVTGYGQFKGHDINASGEAVKLLPENIEINGKTFDIRKKIIEVVYEDVDGAVDEIWNMKPFLVVHCGVHGEANKIKLEKCSMNGFPLEDFQGKCLQDPIVCLKQSGKCRGLQTELNVDKISKNLNSSHANMFETSCEVGRYLCAYIYLKSLDIDSKRSLFVHVPCINKPFSAQETSTAIYKIVGECIKDLAAKQSS